MTRLVYGMTAGLLTAGFTDPNGTAVQMGVTDISAIGARVNTGIGFPENEYIDIALHFDGGKDENLFAQVVSSGDDGLELRWLHFDPGEEERLNGVLEEYAAGKAITGEEKEISKPKKQTRRIARPRKTKTVDKGDEGDQDKQSEAYKRKTSAIMPFADSGGGGSETKRESRRIVKPRSGRQPAAKSGGGDEEAGQREGTRRVVRPRSGRQASVQQATSKPLLDNNTEVTPFGGSSALTGGPGEDSGNRHVVIEPTARFEKLEDTDAAKLAGQKKKKKKSADGEASAKKKTTVFTKDGKIDVGSTLKNRAKTVRASDLAARHDKVRVLNMSTIKELIQAAVQDAVDRMGGMISEDQKNLLLKEAEAEFKQQMKAFQAEKEGLEAQQKNLQGQLERAEKLLEDEKKRKISADQFTVSEQGMEDLAKRFDRLVTRAIQVNGVNDQLADELRNMVMAVLDDERENIAEQARQAQSQAIAMLEKKVSRLAGQLTDAEEEADLQRRRAAALEASGGGLSNIMEAGLRGDDPDKAKKLELLKVIRDENREMRESLEEQGIKIEARRRPKPQPVADEAADAAAGAAGEDSGDDEAVATEATAPADAEEALEPVAAAAVDEDLGEYESMGNPDDEVWEPGMSFATDVKGDDEGDDDGAVKKMTDFEDFAPPPLERKADSAADTNADAAEAVEQDDEDDPYAAMGDPDDEIWEPGMTVSSEPKGDDETDEGDGAVKKMTDFKDFEPPPLQRKG